MNDTQGHGKHGPGLSRRQFLKGSSLAAAATALGEAPAPAEARLAPDDPAKVPAMGPGAVKVQLTVNGCPPEATRGSDLQAYCLKRFGARVLEAERMPTLAHTFSHFTLDIQPLRLKVSALAPQAAEPGVTWLPLEDARGAAIPTPVRKILASL